MRRWLRPLFWLLLLGALAVGWSNQTLAQPPASSASDVVDDAELPEYAQDQNRIGLPLAEELPPAEPDRRDEPIDDLNADALEELPPALPGTDATELDESAPEAMFHVQESTVNSELNAELIPQETIRERYPDGSVKIERGVTQDEQENYVNHGPWRSWNEDGNLIAEGSYRFGERHGRWVRWYQPDDADLFAEAPFHLFNGPFVSQAHFVDGQLDGKWIITDKADLTICEWEFKAGRRHGPSVWYYPTGRKMRLIHYRAGELHGELLEWDVHGNPVIRVQYIEGRRHEQTVQTYADGQKKIEGMVLQARLVMNQPDEWWEAVTAQYVTQGKDQKHGEWKAWYPNGQQRFEGNYQFDKSSGDFTWYHPNGQKSLKAYYEQGVKQGQWTWWHPNGQKSIQGQYQDDSATGRWVWWHDTGKVAQRVDFSQAGSPVANQGTTPTQSIYVRQPGR